MPQLPENPQSSDSCTEAGRPTSSTAPAEGERRAQRGYGRQYLSSAAAIYAELDRGDLLWVGLADRAAGIADDLVLGFADRVIGHQFKASQFPGQFRLNTLLMGENGLIKPLANAWQLLKSANPDEMIEIRFVTNDIPSTNDTLGAHSADHSAAFLAEFEQHQGRGLSEWRTTRWQPFIDTLYQASGLDEPDFEQFLQGFRLLYGSAADFVQLHRLSPEGARLAAEIAKLLPQLVADCRDKDRWTRAELLHDLKWRDSAITRHSHLFPVGAHVQRNVESEEALRQAIRSAASGYIALVGPPGAGKSTLLQTALATEAGLLVARYLAYVPGVGQGVGRGEADDFLEDIATQLKNSGLIGVRFWNDKLPERREQFGTLLRRAGERFQRDHVRTLIVVDGLDHVPREENPQRSFLAELPLPEAVPEGVLFVLGTQRLDLHDLKPAVRDQADASDRRIAISPLNREAVHRMADLLDLDSAISRDQVFDLSQGHPLVTRYLIEALREADEKSRTEILAGAMRFEGDIEAIYESAWRGIQDDDDARNVMDYIARAEGAIPLELLAKTVPEPAIERALKSTKHLLTESSRGWSVFHNSFRLFILGKPRLRLGKEDTGYSAQVYRKLAKLASAAPTDTPQRWLELRYLARAQDQADVLQLAQPARFRHQMAEGRAASELQADIRLALAAAKETHNATVVMRLLLARDEIGRRSTTLEQATSLTEALLAVGNIDAAQASAEEYGNGGYKVVDALLAAGEDARAKDLFEKLEPLQQLLTGHLDTHGFQQNHSEFIQWARRVFRFRDVDQINQAIERLASAGSGHMVRESEDEAAQLAANLRYEVVLAILASRPDTDPAEISQQMNVQVELLPDLLVHAGLRAHKQGSHALAMTLFRNAVGHEHFLEVQNAWRRRVALIMARAGDIDVARTIFDGLTVPAISALDDETNPGAMEHLVSAVMEHAQLAKLIGQSVVTVAPSKNPMLRPLQLHASAIGALLGRAQADSSTIAPSEVVRTAGAALSYLAQVRPNRGGEFFAMSQIVQATPVLGRALIRTAAMCGEREFALVLGEFDRAFETLEGNSGIRANLQREVAVAIYRANGDADEASRRLEPLVASLREDTPSAQVDGIASLAIAFAKVGNHARARELLNQLPNECLGYALPPKKDPQYDTWLELLARADTADPARRGERVAFLMRQVDGMVETEGRSAAYRIAASLIAEAAMHNAGTGYAAARELSGNSVIGWANLVDALLLGTVKRRSDLAMVCGIAWCSMALPYYMEPYFRESHLGEFVEAVITVAADGEVEALMEMLRVAIETDSRAHERSALLRKLRGAALGRGHTSSVLDDALSRWEAESPPARHSYTAMKYDEITALAELKAMLERESGPEGPSYEAPRAFDRLAPAAGFEAACEVFERWPVLQKESRSRFLLFDLALGAGREDYARQMLVDYEASPDERATWTEWTGGSSLRYFRARVKLDGPAIHSEAYEHFVGSLVAGREFISSVMLNIEDILPVITQAPDWPEIWDLLAEQLTTTREHAIGRPFEAVGAEANDEEMIAALFRWALSIPVSELQRHVRVGSLRLKTNASGQIVFRNLISALLDGIDEEPAEALQLLLLDTQETLSSQLGEKVAALADHPDYAVAEAASVLSRRWGRSVSMTRCELPPFYKFILEDQDDDSEVATFMDDASGAMLIEDPLGWTAMFPMLVSSLSRQDITPTQIRHRSRMFIEQWGGLDRFGQTATDQLQANLRRLEMRMPFKKPHIIVALRAIRYVAGELRRAGMIAPNEVSFLLHFMNFPAPTLPLIRPVPRPQLIPRPALEEGNWSGRDAWEKWVQGVENDTRPLPIPNEKVIAEISIFKINQFRRARYIQERIRAPFLNVGDQNDLAEWVGLLPKAVWANGFRALSKELAPTIVRRLSVNLMPEVPPYQIIICPNWLRRLGWRNHPDNWLLYLDHSGQVVARIVWWRDGGPVDVEDDVIWGEGVYITVTTQGLAQIEGISGRVSVLVHAHRKVEPEGSDSEPLSTRVSGRD
jgi:hypothetical protein